MISELISLLRRGVVTQLDGLPAVAIPNDVNIRSTVLLEKDAPRKTGTVTAESLDSLIDYLKLHKSGDTAVFASGNTNLITGILDWHDGQLTSEKGGFGRHRVKLPLLYTEKWKAWMRINGAPIKQKDLAEFIEENLGDIVAPEAAKVLEAVLTLSGKKSVAFKNATRLSNGDTSIVWEETTDAKAGQTGDLQVPSELTLELPVYAGCEEVTTFKIRTMFRYHIDAGTLTFKLQMLGIEHIRELAFGAVYESLVDKLKKDKITAPVYRGEVTTSPLEVYAKS